MLFLAFGRLSFICLRIGVLLLFKYSISDYNLAFISALISDLLWVKRVMVWLSVYLVLWVETGEPISQAGSQALGAAKAGR